MAHCKRCHRKYVRVWNASNPGSSKKSRLRQRLDRPELAMLAQVRSRASRDGREFSIDESDIVIPERCPLLGIALRYSSMRGEDSPSMDRIDSSRGYIKGNVWVISFRANAIKRDATVEELEMISRNLRARLDAPPEAIRY